MEERYKDKRVLITGGMGFIGSNLAIALVKEGADVTILDNMLPRQGGNLFNIKPVEKKVRINFSDIRNSQSVNYIVRNKDYIFHLAGQVSHVDSIKNPLQDLSINVEGTLVILEACRQFNRDVKIIFSGTRGQYGQSVRLPVDEKHPMNPKGVYAITNLCAENLVMVYDEIHKIRAIALRITNTYGPRHQMMHDEYGVLNWFIRQAIDSEVIPIFGSGKILRDFLFIEDLIEVILLAGLNQNAYGEIFNVGTGKPTNFIELAKIIVKIAKTGKIKFTEFSQERKEIEPGDYYADISKICSTVGWKPRVDLENGIQKTIDYYRSYKRYYW
ncbi:MAG: NAD-dependent dehydratase [Omnitrophica WOR_2 bacterium GWF2_43_52]|nr:MAG: NAD-dependent dehydratase [Omnitrophica WOR_2 bacterium GWA2_37_7]OGX21187.1 MAG: NAD-dependent dehydratase [Omnitrophica WOR_2 bacterium GWF2_43_52]HAH20371.1 NAD-dependent dehydratase [Candidatus Omnitrophota bacterium]HBG62856.1 NAD-dependent dehydratase [Candidatus Omnitrophota bacterium]